MRQPPMECGFPNDVECTTALKSLYEYCGNGRPNGLDGLIPDNKASWTLKHVMILLRHGDETPPVPPSNVTKVEHSKHWKVLNEDPTPYLDRMDGFEITEIERQRKANAYVMKDSFFKPGVGGEITRRGFLQCYHLGKYLAERYSTLLQKVKDPRQLYVRSTRHSRTIQVSYLGPRSAAARSLPVDEVYIDYSLRPP